MQPHSFLALNGCSESLVVNGQAIRLRCSVQLPEAAPKPLPVGDSKVLLRVFSEPTAQSLLLEISALIYEFQINTVHKRACHAFLGIGRRTTRPQAHKLLQQSQAATSPSLRDLDAQWKSTATSWA